MKNVFFVKFFINFFDVMIVAFIIFLCKLIDEEINKNKYQESLFEKSSH